MTARPYKGPGSRGIPQELMVNGVHVVLTKKKVKNINMRVKSPDGHLEISAPPWISTPMIETFVQEKMEWIQKKQQAIRDAPKTDSSGMRGEELARIKAEVAFIVEALVSQWEPILGVRAQKLAYRNMTSRWGSCNPSTGRICLNIQLINYPEACLEYVVVHELCHLLERGHGPRFKALLDHYLPDWRERRALLR